MVATKKKKAKKGPPKKVAKKKAAKKSSVIAGPTGKEKVYAAPKGFEQQLALYQKCMFLFTQFGMPGNKRKMDTDMLEISLLGGGSPKQKAPKKKAPKKGTLAAKSESDVDKDMLDVQRTLLKSPELEAIRRHDARTKKRLGAFTMDSPLNTGGIYLIPHTLIDEAWEYLKKRKIERQELIEEFIKMYPVRIQEAAKRLRKFFDQSLYPTDAAMRVKFKMQWWFRDLGLSDDLKTVNEVIYQEQSEAMKEELGALHEDIAGTLRLGLKDMLGRFIKALKPNAKGHRGRLYKTNAESVIEFLELFDKKNLVGDGDCQKLVDQVKKLVQTDKGDFVDADYLVYKCQSDGYRSGLLKDFETAATAAEELIVVDESRMIDLD